MSDVDPRLRDALDRFTRLSAAYQEQAKKIRTLEAALDDARADAFAAKMRAMELETEMIRQGGAK